MAFNILHTVRALDLILIILHVSQSQTEVFNITIEKDYKLTGSDLDTKAIFDFSKVRSLPICAQFCVLRVLCASIVYDTVTEQCTGYIVRKGSDRTLKQATNNIYVDASDIPKQIVCGECANSPCEKYEWCDPFSGNACFGLGQCSNYHTLSDEVATVTKHQFAVVKCDDSDDSDETTTKTSWCYGQDKWTPINLNCD